MPSNVTYLPARIGPRTDHPRFHGHYCYPAFDLPASYPNDPVDRSIGATALVEEIPLLTADAQIRKSRAVPTIW